MEEDTANLIRQLRDRVKSTRELLNQYHKNEFAYFSFLLKRKSIRQSMQQSLPDSAKLDDKSEESGN